MIVTLNTAFKYFRILFGSIFETLKTTDAAVLALAAPPTPGPDVVTVAPRHNFNPWHTELS